jgi:transcriptional regulator with XRE-family HTH domain
MTVTGRFGEELRKRREAAGLSLIGLSKQVHYSKGHLSKVENGLKGPTVQLARLCDSAIGAGGELLRLVVTPQTRPMTPPAQAPEVEPEVTGIFRPRDDDGPAEDGMADHLLAGGDTAALVTLFRDRFESARKLAQLVGAKKVLPGLIADTRTVRRTAAAAEPAGRPALWLLAARYAEFTGWMAQEAGDDVASMRWTDVAVRLAALGGDPAMASYALVRRADVTLHAADALATISWGVQAQSDERVPARIRGLAAQREAQGYALTGDRGSCERALARSANLLAEAAEAAGPLVLGTTNAPDLHSLIVGWCLHDLGDPGRAADILDRAVAGFAPGARRNRTRYVTRTALAHAMAGDLDRACELMGTVVDQLPQLESATIRHDVRLLDRVLVRWHSHPPAREMRLRLLRALHTPDGTAES